MPTKKAPSEAMITGAHVHMTCRDCGHQLVAYCPACRGRKGGSKTSPAKTRAARKAVRVRWQGK